MAVDQSPPPIASSSRGRISGKPWKDQKTATVRSNLQPTLKSRSFTDRIEKAKKAKAIKAFQVELREEKQAEIKRRREVTLERRKIADERKRAEELKIQLGARKAARLQRRAGRTKKVAH
ncbi:hypothetical protein B0F90DRAFT_1621831 [Multifurca ochricompacta]|uniref:rRNA-processing protein n=1 Tax=Multifurca ochricompacta TaxID=376703 RepID=A0AAD4MCZ1_9AGAM|nr:hypothetical protein B0F90DRAFT_1621831 [Multifurca ochricompacta]